MQSTHHAVYTQCIFNIGGKNMYVCHGFVVTHQNAKLNDIHHQLFQPYSIVEDICMTLLIHMEIENESALIKTHSLIINTLWIIATHFACSKYEL